jgi:peptidoglycan/xylan/chitin deacetylase (PgdA/CDA1 family)
MRAILTFHSIDDSGAVLSYAPAAFADLLAGLAVADLPVLTLDDLLAPTTRRGVALTFDDGWQSVHRAALPVLRDHDAPAHLFLTTGAVGETHWAQSPALAQRQPMLVWNEVEALHAAGVRIEGHTATHPDLRGLSEAEITAECDAADATIAQRLGRAPRYFAYPFGYSDDRVRDAIRGRYAAAVTTDLRPLRDDEDPAALPRLDTYYLQSGWLRNHLDARPARAYLALRHAARRLRHRA